MKKISLTGALMLVILSLSVAQSRRINFQAPQLYPEGITYDQQKKLFYVGSVRTGAIGSVDEQGNYKEIYKSNDLISSFGMKVVPATTRLWICLSDQNPLYSIYSSPSTLKKMARVIAIDLKTNKKVADVDLASLYNGPHFLNDLTYDTKGNLYITDSFSPVIYKIDQSGKASIFAQNELFRSAATGLNGIVFHPSGFLLAVNNGDGTILKIAVNNPSDVQKVAVDRLFSGGDGLIIDKQNRLLIAQNKGINKVSCLESIDNWKSAKVIAATDAYARFQFPSTIALQNDKIWVLNAKLDELKAKNNPPPSKTFFIQQVELKAAK
ncbi:gluconolaconase [Pedobacter sp. HMF7647]|uniref:Gluconolaconase n=1 Tax=Hufsiella arboris TaxID=2695275 RepID=A0A7K1YCT0_9SPHI|nr:SMP-30/gluconolactonase/LRE family protein [Hufsiella arboris]MXV52392.1 gluconolaconase [Hufsiella arboris]